MGSIFGSDSVLTKFLNRIATITILSIYWVICCLPVFTIGASTTALYYASLKNLADEGTLTKNFFHSFKQNLVQSIILEVIVAVVFVAAYFGYQIAAQYGLVGQIIFGVILFAIMAVTSYLFPLLSRFVLTIPQLFRNSVIMCIADFPSTILIVVTNLTPFLLLLLRMDYFVLGLPLIVMLGPGLIAYLNASVLAKIFVKYMPAPLAEAEEVEESSEEE